MQGLYEEIIEIPERADLCLSQNSDINLPLSVPYVGMGSSYFAALTLQYCGKNIHPYIASEYYYYLASKQPLGVLISQSGESSETVWNLENFDQVISVTNNIGSSLGTASNVKSVIDIKSGEEHYSSTKSYINTLIAMYVGLGIDPAPAIRQLKQDFTNIETEAKQIAKQLANYIKSVQSKGLYVIGSGPNYGTALQAALTLSETTKLAWIGMPVAQYDHGPKETAENSIVIILNSNGKDGNRIKSLKNNLKTNSNALVVDINEGNLPEMLSPVTLITKLNFVMNYLADELSVGDTFSLGGKVTTVDDTFK